MDDFQLIASSCPNGDCPSIFKSSRTGRIRVRGADPLNPGQERDVDFDPQVFADLVSQLP